MAGASVGARDAGEDLVDMLAAAGPGGLLAVLAGGRTAAVCSGAYCLSSSLWAPKNDKVNLGGRGWIIDPEGNILTTTDDINPFATIEINLEFARQSKATYPRYVPE